MSNQNSYNLKLLGVLVLAALTYFPLNHLASHGHILITSLDNHIPLAPVFAIPYLLFLPIFWITILSSYIKKRLFVQLALAAIIVYVCSDVLYAVFQTWMPRPHLADAGLPTQLVRFIYDHDQPFNDFPSGHASSATLFALYFFAIHHRWRVLLGIFATSVVMATVLIKQHSIIGALGGVLLALATWFSVSHFLSKRQKEFL